MPGDKVSDCVEALCQTGCCSVRDTIRAMEQGLGVSQTRGLSDEEKREVLRELKAIMAVYDRR